MMNAERSSTLFWIHHSSFVVLHSDQVSHHAPPQRPQVVAAFEHADDLAAAVNVRDVDELARHLLERVFAELDVGERVFAMAVEAGGNKQQLGAEMVELR